MISYFDFNGDAFKVKWSHGVNSKEALINALNSKSNKYLYKLNNNQIM